jgi:hypothetical protein
MNIALTTISLLIFLLPGFLFRRFYYTGEFSKEYFKENISDLIYAGIIPSFVIHFFGYWLFIHWKYDIDIKTVGILLSGSSDVAKAESAFSSLYKYSGQILCYFVGVGILGMLLGYTAKWIVRKNRLDTKINLFRFQNEWFYLFSGEILQFSKIPGKNEEKIDFIYIDVLVGTHEGTIIYSGLLKEYMLSKSGGIDRLYLTEVKRRYLKDDGAGKEDSSAAAKSSDERYYTLPGQLFIIPFANIINLHITYYKLEETSSPEEKAI